MFIFVYLCYESTKYLLFQCFLINILILNLILNFLKGINMNRKGIYIKPNILATLTFILICPLGLLAQPPWQQHGQLEVSENKNIIQ